MKRWLAAVVFGLTLTGVAHAAIDTYEFANDAERDRFRELTKELRCPKCQNQDIADSNAPIATDLRREIYRMLGEGKDNQQILDFMVARYGDFVLYKPPVKAITWLLWGGPLALLVLGLLALRSYLKRRAVRVAANDAPLSADEARRAEALLKESDQA